MRQFRVMAHTEFRAMAHTEFRVMAHTEFRLESKVPLLRMIQLSVSMSSLTHIGPEDFDTPYKPDQIL